MNRLYRKFIHKTARQYFDVSKGQTIGKKICRLPIFTSRFFWGVLKNAVREFRISIRFYPETTKSSLIETKYVHQMVKIKKVKSGF